MLNACNECEIEETKAHLRYIREEVDAVYEWNRKVLLEEEDFRGETRHRLAVIIHLLNADEAYHELKDLVRQLATQVIKNEDSFLLLLVDKENPQDSISYWAIDNESMMRSYVIVSRDRGKRVDKILTNCVRIQRQDEFCFPQMTGNSFFYQPEFLILDSRASNQQLNFFKFPVERTTACRPHELYNEGKVLLGQNENRKALRHFQKAVKLGHAESNYELSQYFFAIDRDLEMGIYYMNIAVEKGSHKAKVNLALNHLKGVDQFGFRWEKNTERALMYLEKLVAIDHPEALHHLARIYLDGKDAEKDLQKALKYFQRSVDLKYFKSYLGLGQTYEELGDDLSAKKCFAEGARFGLEEAKAKMWQIVAKELNSGAADSVSSALGSAPRSDSQRSELLAQEQKAEIEELKQGLELMQTKYANLIVFAQEEFGSREALHKQQLEQLRQTFEAQLAQSNAAWEQRLAALEARLPALEARLPAARRARRPSASGDFTEFADDIPLQDMDVPLKDLSGRN